MFFTFRAAFAALVITLCGNGLALAKAGADAGALPTRAIDSCSWDKPGVNPFTGDVVAAVDRYRDIAPDVRERLKARMARRDYEDMVSIRRDSITGHVKGRDYGPEISEMHFGTHQLCHSVTRSKWSTAMQERGLVYCDSGQCILVPTVCRNVSRISRREVSPDHADAPELLPPIAVVAAPALGEPLSIDRAPSFAEPSNGVGPAALSPPAGLPGGAGPGGGAVFAGGAGVGGIVGGTGSGVLPTAPLEVDNPVDIPPLGPSVPVVAVPEPQTWALLALGLIAVGIARRRAAA
jgi:hypothetical protein